MSPASKCAIPTRNIVTEMELMYAHARMAGQETARPAQVTYISIFLHSLYKESVGHWYLDTWFLMTHLYWSWTLQTAICKEYNEISVHFTTIGQPVLEYKFGQKFQLKLYLGDQDHSTESSSLTSHVRVVGLTQFYGRIFWTLMLEL